MPTPVLMGTLPLTVRTESIAGKTVAWPARIVSLLLCDRLPGTGKAGDKGELRAAYALMTSLFHPQWGVGDYERAMR